MQNVSIVGRDFRVVEEPIGFLSTGDFAKLGAATGAWIGGLFGLLLGAAFLVLPGVGPVIIAGPFSAAILGGLEGALAGAAMGALSGALVGWGVPKNQALKYEAEVKAGKFLVMVRGTPEEIARPGPSSPPGARRAWIPTRLRRPESRIAPSLRPVLSPADEARKPGEAKR